MKSFVKSLSAIAIMGLSALALAYAATVTYAPQGSGAWGKADYIGMPEYGTGSSDFWCVQAGTGCNKFDWQVRNLVISGGVPSGGPYTPAVGHSNMVSAASAMGITLPHTITPSTIDVLISN